MPICTVIAIRARALLPQFRKTDGGVYTGSMYTRCFEVFEVRCSAL